MALWLNRTPDLLLFSNFNLNVPSTWNTWRHTGPLQIPSTVKAADLQIYGLQNAYYPYSIAVKERS